MQEDLNRYKTQLRRYLTLKGVQILTTETPNRIQCPSPDHNDSNPSAVIYDNKAGEHDRVFCPVCNTTFDIFDCAGFLNHSINFSEKLKDIKSVLGTSYAYEKKEITEKPKKPVAKPVQVTVEQAKGIFTVNAVEYSYKKYIVKNPQSQAKFVKAWPYKNEKGEIEIIDVRFECGERKKDVITFFYNGSYIQSRGYPIVLFNRDKIKANLDKAIVIHEGAKKSECAENSLTDFIHTNWNGGCKKLVYCDWSPLKDHIGKIYIYPDDDQITDKEGKLLPWYKQPGIQAALEIKKILKEKYSKDAKIVKPISEARTIKSSGADIVEALQVWTPTELTEWIKSGEEILPLGREEKEPPSIDAKSDEKFPFRILGMADESSAYFINYNGYLQKVNTHSASKTHLMNLASLDWWIENFDNGKGACSWDRAIDWLIQVSGKIDFDPDNVRGRGAWREPDDSIVYHDGEKTIGDLNSPYYKKRVYVRMPKRDLKIENTDPDLKKLEQLRDLCFNLTFSNKADAIRCLAWSTLSPFTGALSWRPAGLLTGASKAGKTTIINEVIRKIAYPYYFTGDSSTEAGIRQFMKNDAYQVVVDESEDKEALLKMMRQSTSDDTGIAAKGTTDQKGLHFTLRGMYLFASINPCVENEQDENRLFRINLVGGKHKIKEWIALKNNIKSILTDDFASQIRSKAWRNLKLIIDMSEKLAPYAEAIHNLSTRESYLDAMLLATWFIVWMDYKKIEDLDCEKIVKTFYDLQPIEEKRNESKELLNKVLHKPVLVYVSNKPRQLQIIEICNALYYGTIDNGDDTGEIGISNIEKTEFKRTLAMHGLAVHKDMLAISNNHNALVKIFEKKDYKKLLWRDPDVGISEDGKLLKSEVIKFPITKDQDRCTLINIFKKDKIEDEINVIKESWNGDSDDDIPF